MLKAAWLKLSFKLWVGIPTHGQLTHNTIIFGSILYDVSGSIISTLYDLFGSNQSIIQQAYVSLVFFDVFVAFDIGCPCKLHVMGFPV